MHEAELNLAERGAAGLTAMELQALACAGLALPTCGEAIAAHDRLILRGLAIRIGPERVMLTVEGYDAAGALPGAAN
jgi:hypothetical protein